MDIFTLWRWQSNTARLQTHEAAFAIFCSTWNGRRSTDKSLDLECMMHDWQLVHFWQLTELCKWEWEGHTPLRADVSSCHIYSRTNLLTLVDIIGPHTKALLLRTCKYLILFLSVYMYKKGLNSIQFLYFISLYTLWWSIC